MLRKIHLFARKTCLIEILKKKKQTSKKVVNLCGDYDWKSLYRLMKFLHWKVDT